MHDKLKPSRLAHRSTTNREDIIGFLQRNRFCTVACVDGGKPRSLPTGYCIHNNQLVIHGSVKSHFLQVVKKARHVCTTVFSFEGLVLAASAFHHSVNYHSAVIYGEVEEIADPEEKLAALREFTDQMVPGRWDALRPITPGEIKATIALACPLDTASLKFRTGPPSFEKEDAGFPVWTGVLPQVKQWGQPVPDPGMETALEIPDHVLKMQNSDAY